MEEKDFDPTTMQIATAEDVFRIWKRFYGSRPMKSKYGSFYSKRLAGDAPMPEQTGRREDDKKIIIEFGAKLYKDTGSEYRVLKSIRALGLALGLTEAQIAATIEAVMKAEEE